MTCFCIPCDSLPEARLDPLGDCDYARSATPLQAWPGASAPLPGAAQSIALHSSAQAPRHQQAGAEWGRAAQPPAQPRQQKGAQVLAQVLPESGQALQASPF